MWLIMKKIGRVGMIKSSLRRLLSHVDIQIGWIHSKIYFWLEFLDLIEFIMRSKTSLSIGWGMSIMSPRWHQDRIRFTLKVAPLHQLCIFYRQERILMTILKSFVIVWMKEIKMQQSSSNICLLDKEWEMLLPWWSSKVLKKVTGFC